MQAIDIISIVAAAISMADLLAFMIRSYQSTSVLWLYLYHPLWGIVGGKSTTATMKGIGILQTF